MKRSMFLTIAAVVSILFAVFLFMSPGKMMEQMGSQPCDTTYVMLQVISVFMFSIGVMTFLARNDGGSIALRALFIGSIVMHIGLIPIDWIAYQKGIFTQISGFIPGTVLHIIFAIGFIYYLRTIPAKQ